MGLYAQLLMSLRLDELVRRGGKCDKGHASQKACEIQILQNAQTLAGYADTQKTGLMTQDKSASRLNSTSWTFNVLWL